MKRNLLKFLFSSSLAFTLFIVTAMPHTDVYAANKYNRYSSQSYGWGLGRNTTHASPSGTLSQTEMKKYNAYYIGNHKKNNKVIYLTFDCGYENGNTSSILDTLKKNNIKAIFFVTEPYIKSNVNLVKRMKKEGHLVGNHTVHHPDIAGLSYNSLKNELYGCETTMKKLTGYTLDKYVRPPMGRFSKRSLKICQDLGYTSILWSMAFYDYDVNNQPGKNKIISDFDTYYHNGAITLLHVVSSSDTQALQTIIRKMKKRGYTFKSFVDIQSIKTKKGKKCTIRVPGVSGKLQWSTSSSKISIVSSKGKHKQKVTINAKKTGKCTLYAKDGLKTYKFKIRIVK